MDLLDHSDPICSENTEPVKISKTQRKKELKLLDLPDEIESELLKIIPVKSHPVRNRLLKGVGSLIRSSDEKVSILKIKLR